MSISLKHMSTTTRRWVVAASLFNIPDSAYVRTASLDWLPPAGEQPTCAPTLADSLHVWDAPAALSHGHSVLSASFPSLLHPIHLGGTMPTWKRLWSQLAEIHQDGSLSPLEQVLSMNHTRLVADLFAYAESSRVCDSPEAFDWGYVRETSAYDHLNMSMCCFKSPLNDGVRAFHDGSICHWNGGLYWHRNQTKTHRALLSAELIGIDEEHLATLLLVHILNSLSSHRTRRDLGGADIRLCPSRVGQTSWIKTHPHGWLSKSSAWDAAVSAAGLSSTVTTALHETGRRLNAGVYSVFENGDYRNDAPTFEQLAAMYAVIHRKALSNGGPLLIYRPQHNTTIGWGNIASKTHAHARTHACTHTRTHARTHTGNIITLLLFSIATKRAFIFDHAQYRRIDLRHLIDLRRRPPATRSLRRHSRSKSRSCGLHSYGPIELWRGRSRSRSGGLYSYGLCSYGAAGQGLGRAARVGDAAPRTACRHPSLYSYGLY